MRNLDRFLGDGGMPLLAELGVVFDGYGPEWSHATWTVRAIGCNPAGIVQAGVYGVVLDASMYFALVASLEPKMFGATLEMSVQTITAARADEVLSVRGTVTRIGNTVAFCEARVTRGDDVISIGHATFAVRRGSAD